MLRNSIAIFFLFLLIFSAQIPAKTTNIPLKTPGILTVCSYSEFKPVSYAKGEGYEPDMLRAIAKLLGVKIRFIPEKNYEGIWRLPSQKNTLCDISAGGMTPMQYRRAQGAVFSKTTTHFKQSLLIRTRDYQNGSIRSYNDFKNNRRKIGVVPSTTGEEFAHQRAKENTIDLSVFVQYASESELLPALKQGKIDAIARGEIGNDYQASIDPQVKTIAKKDYGEKFAFVVDSNNPELLRKLNHSIEKITDHGKIGFSLWLKDHAIFMKKA